MQCIIRGGLNVTEQKQKTKSGNLIFMTCQCVRRRQVNKILVARQGNSFFLSHKLVSVYSEIPTE